MSTPFLVIWSAEFSTDHTPPFRSSATPTEFLRPQPRRVPVVVKSCGVGEEMLKALIWQRPEERVRAPESRFPCEPRETRRMEGWEGEA